MTENPSHSSLHGMNASHILHVSSNSRGIIRCMFSNPCVQSILQWMVISLPYRLGAQHNKKTLKSDPQFTFSANTSERVQNIYPADPKHFGLSHGDFQMSFTPYLISDPRRKRFSFRRIPSQMRTFWLDLPPTI